MALHISPVCHSLLAITSMSSSHGMNPLSYSTKQSTREQLVSETVFLANPVKLKQNKLYQLCLCNTSNTLWSPIGTPPLTIPILDSLSIHNALSLVSRLPYCPSDDPSRCCRLILRFPTRGATHLRRIAAASHLHCY